MNECMKICYGVSGLGLGSSYIDASKTECRIRSVNWALL